MELQAATPVLTVLDVNRSAAWYGERLGFRAELTPSEGRAAFAILERDGVELMLQRCGRFGWLGTLRRGWDVYLRVDDVAPWLGALHGKVALRGPTDKGYGCREVEVTDPDGHVLVLSQPLAPAAGPVACACGHASADARAHHAHLHAAHPGQAR